jgi:exosortase A
VKAGEMEVLPESSTDPTTAASSASAVVPSVWRPALFAASLSALALVLVYAATFESMVSIWWRSETFAHGFFILPISLYLVWTEKESLRSLKPVPDAWGVAAVALFGFGWLLARLANALVVEQYCAVASLIAVLYTVLGREVSRRVAFPLGFLLFAVPVGEALIPTLIDYTAAFAVWALNVAGIPVFQSGNVLTLPNGVWSVVEACSGLRYLIACITIGLPFAYLTYTSWLRRAAFVALSVVVPIVANWVRAFLIIWLGYVSNMKLAVGIDHLIYGWIFYAVVMFLLLWVGSLFRDQKPGESPGATSVLSEASWPRRRTIVTGIGALVCAALFPIWASYAERAESGPLGSNEALTLPDRLESFSAVGGVGVGAGAPAWKPEYVGADSTVERTYAGPGGKATLHVALYRHQRQGAELVSSENPVVRPDNDSWQQIESRGVSTDGPGSVDEHVLASSGGDLLVWRWYWVGGHLTTSPVWAKIIEGARKLIGHPTPAAGIVLFTATGRDTQPARQLLEALSASVVTELAPQLERLDP